MTSAVIEVDVTSAASTVFEWVNAFVGAHVECTDIGEDITYEVALTGRTGECVVVVQCACGVSARTLVPSHDGRALITTASRRGLRAREVAGVVRG